MRYGYCQKCKQKNVPLIEHHTPILKSSNGKEVIEICWNCHIKIHYHNRIITSKYNNWESCIMDVLLEKIDGNNYKILFFITIYQPVSLDNKELCKKLNLSESILIEKLKWLSKNRFINIQNDTR